MSTDKDGNRQIKMEPPVSPTKEKKECDFEKERNMKIVRRKCYTNKKVGVCFTIR